MPASAAPVRLRFRCARIDPLPGPDGCSVILVAEGNPGVIGSAKFPGGTLDITFGTARQAAQFAVGADYLVSIVPTDC